MQTASVGSNPVQRLEEGERKKKGLQVSLKAYHKDGVHLLSRSRSTIGRYGLTSVFGMGTGVARNAWTPARHR